ncbi:glycosyltransferase [Candidatus Gracilibacteria bacterium]|nr:glycosyltransferase [Candidatus Gracilibacteria bacterium]
MNSQVSPKIAIVCDWLVAQGGAERVILAFSELFPEAPIYTSIYNKEALPAFKDKKIITSSLQKWYIARKKHHLLLPLMPKAFEEFDLSEFDIVISSCHSCAKGIITKPRTLHICYCHSPTRYLWDNCHEYFEQYNIPWGLRSIAKKMLQKLRIWDRVAAERVDFYLTNAHYVVKRIKKYYRRDATVIYPPIETEFFTPDTESKPRAFFLAVGRLAPYKRFDLIIDACNELQLPLVIVGKGKEEARLRKRGDRFVTFLGSVSDEELRNLYRRSIALIFPQVEDFGITPLEAMSCGTPIVALKEGGALETVVEGKTGVFFEKQEVSSLKEAILKAHKTTWRPDEIRAHAETFSKEVFNQKIKNYIAEKLDYWTREMR